GIADAEETRIDEADHIARISALDRLALAGEEAVRARHAHFAIETRVVNEHVFLEDARRHAHECQAIAMALVHVRLNLEDEAGEGGIARIDAAARNRGGRELENRTEEWLDAEVVDRASEEDRDQPSVRELVMI